MSFVDMAGINGPRRFYGWPIGEISITFPGAASATLARAGD
jgi:hypothetical protein